MDPIRAVEIIINEFKEIGLDTESLEDLKDYVEKTGEYEIIPKVLKRVENFLYDLYYDGKIEKSFLYRIVRIIEKVREVEKH